MLSRGKPCLFPPRYLSFFFIILLVLLIISLGEYADLHVQRFCTQLSRHKSSQLQTGGHQNTWGSCHCSISMAKMLTRWSQTNKWTKKTWLINEKGINGGEVVKIFHSKSYLQCPCVPHIWNWPLHQRSTSSTPKADRKNKKCWKSGTYVQHSQ